MAHRLLIQKPEYNLYQSGRYSRCTVPTVTQSKQLLHVIYAMTRKNKDMNPRLGADDDINLSVYCYSSPIIKWNFLCFLRRNSPTSAQLPASWAQRLQLLSGWFPGECCCRWPVYRTNSPELQHITVKLTPTVMLASVWVNSADPTQFFTSQLDLGIPAMTECCNQLDGCYDTCGTNKYDCDSKFRTCMHGICSDLKKSLGFGSKVQGENIAKSFFSASPDSALEYLIKQKK